MRKVIAALIIPWFMIATIAFLLLVNFRLTIFKPETVKSLLVKSDAYEFVAGSIREGLIRGGGSEATNSAFFEIIVESVDAETMQKVTEQAIDQFFLVAANPKDHPVMVIPLSQIGDQIAKKAEDSLGVPIDSTFDGDSLIGKDKEITLGNNPAVALLGQINSITISFGVMALFLLVLIFLFSASSANGRFLWLGWSLIFTSLPLFCFWIIPHLFGAQVLDQIISGFAITDLKLITAVKRLYELVAVQQTYYLATESIALFVAGLLTALLGRGLKEEKIEIVQR